MNTLEEQTDPPSSSDRRPDSRADGAAAASLSPFFTCPELTQILDLVGNLTENSQRIPLVKGPEGSGKTTLLFQLQSRIPAHWAFCRIDANPMMHPEQLHSLLAQHFGIPEKDDQVRAELLSHFEQLRRDGRRPVIAIDDAHLLPADTVAELLQLHTASTAEERTPLHCILFAAPAIEDTLQTAGLQPLAGQLIQTLEMPPLTPEQAASYITQMLLARGALEAFALTPSQIDRIVRSSQGLPGEIENLLAKLPAHPTTPQKPTERSTIKLLMEDLPVAAIAGTVGLISLLSLLLLFQDEINAVFYKTPIESIAAENRPEIALKLPPPPRKPEPPPRALPVEEPEPVTPVVEEASATVAPPSDKSGPQPEAAPPAPAAPQADTAAETPVAPAITPPKPEPVAPVVEEAAVTATPPGDKSGPQPEAAPPAPVAPQADTAAETPVAPAITSPKNAIAPKTTPPVMVPEVAVKPPAQPRVKPPAKPKPVAVGKPADRKAPRREAWLLSQPPTAYTLQVIGLTDPANMAAYIKQHGLTEKAAYFETSRNGRPWYPLLYGVYPDRAAAVAARPGLASRLRQKGIWVRSLDSVQKEIRAAQASGRP